MFQASALEKRLEETKAKLKEEQEMARKKLHELNETNSQVVRPTTQLRFWCSDVNGLFIYLISGKRVISNTK